MTEPCKALPFLERFQSGDYRSPGHAGPLLLLFELLLETGRRDEAAELWALRLPKGPPITTSVSQLFRCARPALQAIRQRKAGSTGLTGCSRIRASIR
ncbi:hypothetical protein [Marinobacterium aestuariivivens]|uniref:Uncharacterized protein n=1 Tax=Marinobacterium aestuariivivens TaxID=1698799 RepID=A0ABW1ZTL9_9GAMM